MKKKLYEKPTSKVYELKQQPQLLAGSANVNASLRGYGSATDYTWDEEE